MKFPFYLTILVCIIITACSSPESVAEKALREIGDGKYKTGVYGKEFLNEDLFTYALLENDYGESFSKYGGISGELKDRGELRDIFFKTDYLFDKIKLIDQKEYRTDIYGFDRKYGDDDETFDILKKYLPDVYDGFRCNDYVMAWLKYKSIPKYILRYKVDNKAILNVIVLKLPKEGYRVASVTPY